MQKLKYIQVQVHEVMNFTDPDEGVPVYDEKSNYASRDTTEGIETKPKSASQTGAPSRPRQPRREANPTRSPGRAAEPRRAPPPGRNRRPPEAHTIAGRGSAEIELLNLI